MDHTIREKVKARLAALRERFGDDDPDVTLFSAFVEETEPAAPEAPPEPPPEAP